MKIFLAGGGTGGATAPVLAAAEALADLAPHTEFFLVGNHGAEKKMTVNPDLAIIHLSISAGKWRRYFSVMNFFDIFKTAAGFFKSLYLIRKYRPDMIFGAGSFVQVPLSWAGFVLNVPVVIHQPDLELLLSTRLVAPFAKAVTVSFLWSGKNFSQFSGLLKKIKKSKVHVTGNPARAEVFGGSKERAQKSFGLNADYPVMLVMGGSQGSARVNEIVLAAAPELVKYVQVIHVTGGKSRGFQHQHYHAYDYLAEELKDAYAAADFVLARAGISTITELSALKKSAIIVPLPKSPQETNARLLAYTTSAVVVFEEHLNPELVVSLSRKMIWNHEAVEIMKQNIGRLLPAAADKKIAKILLKIYDQSHSKKSS